MRDKDKVASLLSELGIEFEVTNVDRMSKGWKAAHARTRWAIRCIEGMDKVEGYSGFETDFYFDTDGDFVCMGIWE